MFDIYPCIPFYTLLEISAVISPSKKKYRNSAESLHDAEFVQENWQQHFWNNYVGSKFCAINLQKKR